jgi:teichuronic acid biosynthesis glycosyltransferase TuaG
MLRPAYDDQLVSIITPAYNAEPFIAATIRSVLAQTYPHWEMIIVDDGSTDGTAAVVEGLAAEEPRIRLFRLPTRDKAAAGGPARARTCALSHARGRYVAFLDADDLWLEHKLERQVAFMKQNQAAMSFTGFRRISSDGGRVGRLMRAPRLVKFRTLLVNNVIGCLTVMIDRVQVAIPPLTPGYHEDYMLWLAILQTGVVAHGLDEDLGRYRVVAGSRSSKRLRAIVWRWKNYRIQAKLSVLESAFFFVQYLVMTFPKHIKFFVGWAIYVLVG